MLKCCGCQTNFILSLGGSFLFSKNFLSTPSLTGGLVMPIRRTINKKGAPLRVLLNIILLRRLAKYRCDIRFVHHQDHPIRQAFFAFLQHHRQSIQL